MANHTYRIRKPREGDDRTTTFSAEPGCAGGGYDQRLSDALDWAHWIEDHAEDLAGAKVAAGFAAGLIIDVAVQADGKGAGGGR